MASVISPARRLLISKDKGRLKTRRYGMIAARLSLFFGLVRLARRLLLEITLYVQLRLLAVARDVRIVRLGMARAVGIAVFRVSVMRRQRRTKQKGPGGKTSAQCSG
jgi:hypothetical protein